MSNYDFDRQFFALSSRKRFEWCHAILHVVFINLPEHRGNWAIGLGMSKDCQSDKVLRKVKLDAAYESVEWISKRLIRASFYACDRVVKVLLECGADPNYHTEDFDNDMSPMNVVSQRVGNRKMLATYEAPACRAMTMLLEAGADPNYTPSWSEPPIYFACRGECHRAVDLLVRYGANIHSHSNTKSELGLQLLFQERPIQRERIALEKSLLEYGAGRAPEERFPESLAFFVGEFVHLTAAEPQNGID